MAKVTWAAGQVIGSIGGYCFYGGKLAGYARSIGSHRRRLSVPQALVSPRLRRALQAARRLYESKHWSWDTFMWRVGCNRFGAVIAGLSVLAVLWLLAEKCELIDALLGDEPGPPQDQAPIVPVCSPHQQFVPHMRLGPGRALLEHEWFMIEATPPRSLGSRTARRAVWLGAYKVLDADNMVDVAVPYAARFGLTPPPTQCVWFRVHVFYYHLWPDGAMSFCWLPRVTLRMDPE